MSKALTTPGQGVFTFGIDPTARILVDSTKFVDSAAQAVGGFPVALVAATGKLNSTAGATGDIFYGAFSSDVNTFAGRTSLGDFTATKANAEQIGRYRVRNSVYLDSNGNEVTAAVFATFAGADYTPSTSDIGKAVHAMLVTVTDSNDAFNGTSMLKWVVSTGSGTGSGFRAVARIVDVSDDGTETEIFLDGAFVGFATGLTGL